MSQIPHHGRCTQQKARRAPRRAQMTTTTTATMTSGLTIRRAYPDDRDALVRLAQLDSGTPPAGAVLVAESSGVIVAALDLERGVAIADPFVPTANIVELLRLHATRAAHEGR